MHKSRIFLLVPALVTLVSIFLPLISLPFLGDISGFMLLQEGETDILFFVLGAVVSMVFCFVPKPVVKQNQLSRVGYLIGAGVCTLFMVILFANMGDWTGGGIISIGDILQLVGIGLWLAIIGTLGQLILGILNFLKKL